VHVCARTAAGTRGPKTRPLNQYVVSKGSVMLAALGTILLIAGVIVTFVIERSADGVDVIAIGWILMVGGALSMLVSMIHSAGWRST